MLIWDTFRYYISDEDQVVIAGYSGEEKNVSVPAEIDGKAVAVIEKEAFLNDEYIENVTLPDSVKEIRSNAFAGCSALKDVTLPETVEIIADDAFKESGGDTQYVARIIGKTGSAGELFAKNNGIEFCDPLMP